MEYLVSKKRPFIYLLVLFLMCSCSGLGGDSLKESRDAIDGYVVSLNGKELLVNPDGTLVFEGKTIVDGDGNKIEGSHIYVKAQVDPSVGGFYHIDAGYKEECYLLGKEQDSKGGLVIYGPFESAGHFFENVTPVTRKDEGITYIHKDGSIAFHIDEVAGEKVMRVTEYEGGLSTFMLKESGLWGAVDTKGEIAILPKYLSLEYIGSGLWAAHDPTKNVDVDYSKRHLDILNSTGEIQFSYSRGGWKHLENLNVLHDYAFSGDYGIFYRVNNYKEFKIVDKKGNVILNDSILEASFQKNDSIDAKDGWYKPNGTHYHELFAVSTKGGGKTRIINKEGELVTPTAFGNVTWMKGQHFIATYKRIAGLYKGDKLVFSGEDDWSHIIPLSDDYFLVTDRQVKIVDINGNTKANLGKISSNSFNYSLLKGEGIFAGAGSKEKHERMQEVPKQSFINQILY